MMKKLVFAAVILVLVAGGFFYWWQNQADVRALNKTLPEGVRVVKSLVGNEYGVKNKIDDYEIKIPKIWKGLRAIDYIAERSAEGYVGTSLTIEGKEGVGRSFGIDRYVSNGDTKSDLRSWAESNFSTFGLEGIFTEEKINKIDVVKTQETIHLMGEYVYFLEQSDAVYSITGPSEEFIRYIIANGKW